jgi:DNA-binding MarR family transcriptional regulator
MSQKNGCPIFGFYAASRKLIGLYSKELEALELTYPQHLVIATLLLEDGMCVDAIGKKLYLDSGTLTPLLKRLEKNGFIIRKHSALDERKRLIFLTKKGKACVSPLEAMKGRLRAKLNFSNQELCQFYHIINKIVEIEEY